MSYRQPPRGRRVSRGIPLCLLIAAAFPSHAQQSAPSHLGEVLITAPAERPLPSNTAALGSQELAAQRAATSDTASLLRDVPGVSLYGAGGVSSLPAIHGLADDRVRTKVDGMDLIASCPNHMNPALSYVDPSNIGTLKVYAGITPVSVGGDSIAGTIIAETPAPVFAAPGQGSIVKGEIGAFYRSNGNAQGGNLSATYATESLNLSYSGATAESDNYNAGSSYRKFVLTGSAPRVGAEEVGSTAYKTRNHTLGIAMKSGNHLVEAKLGYQDLPYQLYPNQRMDMLDNTQHRLNLRYLGQFGWGNLEARAYHEKVDHYMDFGPDKLLVYGSVMGASGKVWPVVGMPMYTQAKTDGVSIKANVDLNPRDLLRVGAELQHYRLDDWWPPSPDCGVGECAGGMAPLSFWNINDGQRDRSALYGEWEAKWTPQWSSLIGARVEHVTTNAGPVSGYTTSTTPRATGMLGTMYETSSVGTRAAFNAMDRKRSDNNLDLTALARYVPDPASTYEFGIAQKTRSPNLYERYSWSRNGMALEMNNFVGDGNGYLGNPDLKHEVAHTLSLTGDWHSADRETELKVTPYYTHVDDYVDAVQWNRSTNLAASPVTPRTFVILKYANQTARLYGLDLSGKLPLGKAAGAAFGLKGLLNYTNGKNTDTGDELYNIMPLNTKLTLTHRQGGWDNGLELVAVKRKDATSDARNEIATPGYSLINLRASYTWNKLRIDFGVENLFDRLYYLPLGGAYTGEGATMSFNKEVGTVGASGMGTSGTASMWGTAVPGMGRSAYVGVSLKF